MSLKPILFVILPFGLLAQNIVGEWDSYTSTLTVRDIEVLGYDIYCATAGGLLEYKLTTGEFLTYKVKDGLASVDIRCLSRDHLGRLWLGANAPVGEIDIWDPAQNKVVRHFGKNFFGEALTTISDITIMGNKAYAAYQQNMDWGILYFKLTDGDFEYQDFYPNFPMEFSQINRLALVRDTLWVLTSSGVLFADITQTNLKDVNAWRNVTFNTAADFTDLIDFNGIVVAGGDDLYRIRGTVASLWQENLGGSIRAIVQDSYRQLIAGTNQGVYRLGNNQIWSRLTNAAVICLNAEYGLIGGTEYAGIWFDDGTGGQCEIPNTLLDNIYTALYVEDDGKLVAATNRGISFQTDQGWYNVKKEYSGVKISEHADDNWKHFVCDTIAYSLTGRSYSLVKRNDGEYFVSLFGAYLWGERGGGLLRFSPTELASYIVYDTVGGKLAGSAGHGGADDFLAVAMLAMDDQQNLWIANQFAQNDSVVALLTPGDRWYHFGKSESNDYLSYLITSIAFDQKGRVWFGAEANQGSTPSNGGIAVLDYNGTLAEKSDDKWYWVSTTDGLAHNSVYALAFDQEDNLWIMTAGGIQRAVVAADFSNRRLASIDSPLLTNIAFSKECRIKVDGMNNKWITTVEAGVKVYTYNGVWLNDVEGFTTDNSGILSNSVQDVAFYPPDGRVFFATTKGISVYRSPFAYYGEKYRSPRLFPQPFKIPASRPLVIDGLLQNSQVKIMLLDGTFIRHLTAANGGVVGQQALWDGRDQQGNLVSSGIYIFLAYTKEGDSTKGKIAVLRR